MQHRFIVSGGGTGGHIFPAIAIADELKRRYPDAEFLFVGAEGRMEMEKVPESGYKIEGLWISGFQRSISVRNLSFPFKVISSLLKANKILNNFKPDVVIGTGGYASGPVLKAATKKGLPTLILEQNSYAGVTNKLLGAKVSKICVAFEGMERFFPSSKIVLTGNPVRQNIADVPLKADLAKTAYDFFGFTAEKKTVLVIGGSLGARTINESIKAGLEKFKQAGVQLIWQCGKAYYEIAKESVKSVDYSSIKVFPFIREMDLAYSIADIIISRAGAIAISELCLLGKPAILVPSPNVAEDHQTKNAKALSQKEAAILVPDIIANELLVNECLTTLNKQEKLLTMSEKIKKMGKPDAVKSICDCIEELLKKGK